MMQHKLKKTPVREKGVIYCARKVFSLFWMFFRFFLYFFLKYFSHFFTVFRQEKYTETNTSCLKSADFE